MLIILVFRAVATSFLWSCALLQVVTYAPMTLFPSPVPKSAFHQALAVQVHYNTLVDKISQDADFLQMALARYLLPTAWAVVYHWLSVSAARSRQKLHYRPEVLNWSLSGTHIFQWLLSHGPLLGFLSLIDAMNKNLHFKYPELYLCFAILPSSNAK